MYRAISVVILCILVVGLLGTSGLQAHDTSEEPDFVLEAMYANVTAGDIDAALEYLTDDAVLTIVPAPDGQDDAAFIGKEEIGPWWEGLYADGGRAEFSNVQIVGQRATWTANWHSDMFDEIGMSPMEFEGVAIILDGKVRSMIWAWTAEYEARLAEREAENADSQLVRRILQEIWSEGNLDLIDELVAEDYVSHTWPIGEGRAHFEQDVLSWRSDFPGGTIVVDRIEFDGNRAIIFSHIVGPDGSLDEPLPEDAIPGILIYQLEDGRLSDRWYFAPFNPLE